MLLGRGIGRLIEHPFGAAHVYWRDLRRKSNALSPSDEQNHADLFGCGLFALRFYAALAFIPLMAIEASVPIELHRSPEASVSNINSYWH